MLALAGCKTENPATQAAEAGDLPNILLILSDDHSAPYLGCYGHPDLKTPNLDRLASQGVMFNPAYTTASQCVPSRASILSGRSVIDIRMSRFSAPLHRSVKTIPDYLEEKGYYTGICGRHYHLDGSQRMPSETSDTFEKYDLVTFPDRVDFIQTCADSVVAGTFTQFLNQAPESKPFFMWMNFSDPHRKFTASEYEPDFTTIAVPESMPDMPEVRKDLAKHDGEIMRLDMHIGQVVDILEKRQIIDNTALIFMGDNGAALLRGKGTLYHLGVHVPMIVHWPDKIKNSIVTDALVSGEDIAPTIIEMAGLKPDGNITGKSFLPALNGADYQGHDYVFSQRVPHSSGLPLHTLYFDLSRSVFNKEHKLIYNALWQLPYTPVDFMNRNMWRELQNLNAEDKLEEKFQNAFFSEPRPMFELYDLKNDPHEFHNLAENGEYAEVLHALKGRLQEWMIVNQDYLPLPIPPKRR